MKTLLQEDLIRADEVIGRLQKHSSLADISEEYEAACSALADIQWIKIVERTKGGGSPSKMIVARGRLFNSIKESFSERYARLEREQAERSNTTTTTIIIKGNKNKVKNQQQIEQGNTNPQQKACCCNVLSTVLSFLKNLIAQ